MSELYPDQRDEMDAAAIERASYADSDTNEGYPYSVPPHLEAPRANPDDPIVRRPPADARGPRPGPDFRGAPGRVAIVQGQVYLVGVILIIQLFLVTTALYELLSGRTELLWWITLAQLVGFLIALVIALRPRQQVKGF